MKLLKRIIIALSIPLFIFRSALASPEFGTAYDITYNVNVSGQTTVRQIVKLSNKLDHLFATEYTVIIGSTKISNITASDNFGELSPEVKVSGNTTNIRLLFDQHLVGKDKVRTIILTYVTPDFATIKGQVLEAGFPLVSNSQDLEDYSVKITIPNKFGTPAQIVPNSYIYTPGTGYNTFEFNKAVLGKFKGITATFGTKQILNFDLRYSLENKEVVRGKTEIALPPDTNYQKVVYSSIDPKPENVTVDADGNWLAQYILEPQSTVTIHAKGTVELYNTPRSNFSQSLSDEEIASFTKPDKYWEVSDPKIVQLAQSLGSPEAIYTYLVDNYIYDYGRVNAQSERFGALEAISKPDNAICMEFTDTFIALTRALHIPAREHNGFGYTENDKLRPISVSQDILHAWPEYYDSTQKQWIQVDPTWGNTTGGLDYFHKFDLDHFSFVTHGIDSLYPVAVAAYKTESTTGKDIDISFGTNFKPQAQTSIAISSLPSGFTGLPVVGEIEIYNSGNTAIYNLPVEVTVQRNSESIYQDEQTLNILPPFSKHTYKLAFTTNWQNSGGIYQLQIKALDTKESSNFELKSVIKAQYLSWGIGGLLGVLVWSIGYKAAYPKRKK